MKAFGYELEFISQIARDGLSTFNADETYIEMMQQTEFTLMNLSLSKETFIAANFNVFVVKLKKPKK